MNKKKEKNYSIFCCYCEEPRKSRPNIQNPRDIIETSNHSKIYKIDTNSNVSRGIMKDERFQNSFSSNTNIKNNNLSNYQINPNSPIKRRGSNDVTNYSLSNIKINNNILNSDKKSNKTSNNQYIKRIMDMSKISQQNGVNSSLKKKNSLIDLVKISLNEDNIEKNKNDNNININNEKKVFNEDNKSIRVDNNANRSKDISFDNKNEKNVNVNQKKLNVLPKIIEYKKGVNGINERNNRINIFEFEDNISKGQFRQNKSNIINNNNKNNFSNIDIINYSNIEHKFNEESKNNDNYNTYSNGDDLKKNQNIINNSNTKYNDNNFDKSIKNNSAFLEKNETYTNNEINNIINNNNNNQSNTKIENESLNKINDSKQDQNDNKIKNNISNILNTNPINETNNDNHIYSNKNIILSDNDTSKENDLNYINDNENIKNNEEIKDDDSNYINSENKGNICSKTMYVKKKENYFFNDIDKDFEAEFDNNSENPKLNYLTGYYDTVPLENKSILMSEQRPTNINENKTENSNINKNNQNQNEEENLKEELEDEVGSIDEFKNTNDNRSILSSYIFSSVHLTESKSIYQSVISKSEYQDAGSNYNDLTPSERGGLNFIFPQVNRLNSREVEFRIGEDANFPFAKKDSRGSNNIPNINLFLNAQLNYSIKKTKEKIIDKDKEIQRNKYLINHLKQKTNDVEKENYKYISLIEGEEEENIFLNQFLKYLMEYN